jgi:hypothetical protein
MIHYSGRTESRCGARSCLRREGSGGNCGNEAKIAADSAGFSIIDFYPLDKFF